MAYYIIFSIFSLDPHKCLESPLKLFCSFQNRSFLKELQIVFKSSRKKKKKNSSQLIISTTSKEKLDYCSKGYAFHLGNCWKIIELTKGKILQVKADPKRY